MPPITRWFVRAALVYFIVALVVGIVTNAEPFLSLPPFVNALGPVYFHLFMVGWVTQLIFGMVYWMFPLYSKEKPRGNDNLWWSTFWLLNVGLCLRAVAEPLHALHPHGGWGIGVAVAAVLQWLGGMAFVVNAWRRVKER